MNKYLREHIQAIKDFNYSHKEHYARKMFGKSYGSLTQEERLDVNDIVEVNKE